MDEDAGESDDEGGSDSDGNGDGDFDDGESTGGKSSKSASSKKSTKVRRHDMYSCFYLAHLLATKRAISAFATFISRIDHKFFARSQPSRKRK